MGHSYTKLWTHVVFSTKNRDHLILPSFELQLHNHIRAHLIEMGCSTRIINGTTDHLHILFLQNPNKSIAEILKNIKGNSSHWINENNFSTDKFAWQTGYGAFAVSESQVQRVYDYIAGQKEHHHKQTFQEEYQLIIELHGLKMEIP